jgi:sugar transferase (PEP-CTERM/EpsH1 system associated)
MAEPRRLRVVFLTQRVPYPPTRGDKIITWRMLKRLHEVHDVTCLAFSHDEDDAAGATELRRLGYNITTVPYRPVAGAIKGVHAMLTGRPLTTSFLGSSQLARELRARIDDIDLAIAFSSSMGAYLLDMPSVPGILHFCELDSDKWRQYASMTRPPLRWIYAREARVLRTLEHRLAHSMNANIVCTSREKVLFQAEIPGTACAVMPNGVDLAYFSPRVADAEPGHLVFTGIMNYYPNVDGCLWFAAEVLPKIADIHPNARFTIVGANPTHAIRRLAQDPRITVTGRVPDTRPFLRRASIAVAPLRIARGIQNKVLEGLAMAVPVVGTAAAVQGVAGVAGRDYLVGDSPADMADAINRLLSNGVERRALGARGRAFVEANYNWDRSLEVLDSLIATATRV